MLATGIYVPDIVVYAQLALQSPEPALRELAVQQFGKAMQVNDASAYFSSWKHAVLTNRSHCCVNVYAAMKTILCTGLCS